MSEQRVVFDKEVLRDLIRAHGIAAFAESTGLARQQVYNYLGTPGKPSIDTLCVIFTTYGFELEDLSCFFKITLDTLDESDNIDLY